MSPAMEMDWWPPIVPRCFLAVDSIPAQISWFTGFWCREDTWDSYQLIKSSWDGWFFAFFQKLLRKFPATKGDELLFFLKFLLGTVSVGTPTALWLCVVTHTWSSSYRRTNQYQTKAFRLTVSQPAPAAVQIWSSIVCEPPSIPRFFSLVQDQNLTLGASVPTSEKRVKNVTPWWVELVLHNNNS